MTIGSNQPKIKPEMNDATFLGHTFSPSNARPEVSDKVLTAIERRKKQFTSMHRLTTRCHTLSNKLSCMLLIPC